MAEEAAATGTTFGQRMRLWTSRVGLSRKLAIALTAAAVAAGMATYGALTGEEFAPDPRTILLLLNLDLVLLLLLGAVVARQIVGVWVERRRGLAGSKLHVHLVVLFSALAATPAIVVAVFSALFFNLGVQAWFSDRVRVALRESLAVAEAYLDEHRNTIRIDVLAMADDLNREGLALLLNPRRMQQMVSAQATIRSLPEVVVFDGRGQVLARSGLTLSLEFEVVPNWAIERARAGELVIFSPDVDVARGALGDRVRALIRLEGSDDVYLMVGRFVEQRVVAHLDRTREAVAAYQSLEGKRSGLQITFAMIFVLVALLLLLAAIWVGLALATRLARPIGALIAAAEQVRAGDLSVRVSEGRADDELGSLSRAFNRMTSQLDSQRREVVEANRQLDYRRRFTEAVLSGVSAGVIGLDPEGRINLPNRSASVLLSTDLDRMIGRDFGDAVPEMVPLIEAAREAPNHLAESEITVARGGRRRTLIVRIAGERLDGGAMGFVITFDDITELEAAQRKAAWADVARRIAHEIKNPLTPIQLSAERLKRKYLPQIGNDAETFRALTETIIRQVGDIGRMVDEFSSFARMPAPVMREEDLVELVRRTVFLQRNARPEISFVTEIPDQPIVLRLDQRQIGQALTNLLQNAIDAIDGREAGVGDALPPGRVAARIVVEDGRVAVEIDDNGKGLPAEDRDRLTEPYVTTRAKGTGLGLAIVKKIMEDHGGELILADRPGGGARVSLIFVVKSAAGESAAHDATQQQTAGHGPTKAAIHGA
ncbi:MAG: PAS domain-containing sensor histidine kinase [Rhodospirillales bacterium]|nr:PAS domain-containing sensor histidine kinase [Rhodospirillales bacterium]